MKARVVCFQKTEHSDLNFIVRKIYNVICTHWENLPLFLFCLFLHFSFCTINSGFGICGKGRDIRASPQSLNFLFCFLFLDSEITAGGTIHTHSKHTYNHIQHTTTGVENELKKKQHKVFQMQIFQQDFPGNHFIFCTFIACPEAWWHKPKAQRNTIFNSSYKDWARIFAIKTHVCLAHWRVKIKNW